MVGGGRTERGSRRRGAAASAVVPLPRGSAGDRLDLVRLVPSGRSLLLAFALLVGVFASYWGARTSSVFEVDRIDVHGAPPSVAREVRAVTKSAVGTSLLAIDTQEIEAHVRALPSVIATSVDRAFPHTLVVKVAAEHPVAVARRSHRAWLLTGSNRVISAVDADAEPGLPRIWLPRRVSVEVGRTLPAAYKPATRALAGLREIHFPGRIKGVRAARGELTFVLRNGLEILLGDSTEALVKLAVAAKVIPLLEDGAVYLDVSVPERPVSSTYLNSQVEVYSSNTLGR